MESIGEPPSALTATEEDGNAPKFVSNKNPRTPSQPTNIDSLPDELLSEILVRKSAEDIHQRARFVCKRWRRTIHRRAFVTAHFDRSGYGLLLPRWDGHRPTFVGATQGGGIELSELSWKLGSSIMSSCNGLILTIRYPENVSLTFQNPNRTLYIENPAIGRCLDLPLFPGGRGRGFKRVGIAFAAASRQYKVVATCHSDTGSPSRQRCCILTVGVDNAWRHVETHHLSNDADLLLLHDPLITEGFMHWVFGPGNAVLTMNVETEALAESRAPLALAESRSPLDRVKHRINTSVYSYLSTGKNLSVLLCCGKLSWEVWELNGETGEWKKLLPKPNIDCKSKIEELGWGDDVYLIPVGWVKYPENLLFSSSHMTRGCLIYNLVNDEMESVELPFPMPIQALVHKKSMAWFS